MARYQNGLLIDANTGLTFSRWIIEFATQVLGWTLYDNDDAGWTSVVASGADLATTANPDELDFSGAAYTLVAADAGRYVTVLGNVGWSASEKERIGVYKILRVDTATEIAYLDIKRGVHENGLPLSKTNVSYRLWHSDAGNVPANSKFAILRTAYLHTPAEPNMDIKVLSNTGFPYVAIGPFGTWNAGTNAWNDARNTADYQGYPGGTNARHIWAFGDETNKDHFIVIARYAPAPSAAHMVLYYFGAITPTAGTTVDTNPGIVWAGYSDYPQYTHWGYSAPGTIRSGVRMMAYNAGANNVAVTGYPIGPPIGVGLSQHLLSGNRQWSQWSRGIYRIEPMIQCRTSGHMEARGIPKNVWYSGFTQGCVNFGVTPNFYLHVFGGISIPWNGSKVHVQWNLG